MSGLIFLNIHNDPAKYPNNVHGNSVAPTVTAELFDVFIARPSEILKNDKWQFYLLTKYMLSSFTHVFLALIPDAVFQAYLGEHQSSYSPGRQSGLLSF